MTLYTWDSGTGKYISADGQIMGGGTAYKTETGAWSLTKPTADISNKTNQWSSTNYVDSDGYTSATERNMATGGAEFGGTGTKASSSSKQDTINSIRDKWNSYTYEQQQDILKKNPSIQEALTKYGITNKTKTSTGKPAETTTTVKQSPYVNQGDGNYVYNSKTGYYEKVNTNQNNPGNWDYQDNSQARMDQIANNLNNYRVTNPELFNDWGSFYNFFIAGKGRSQEQVDFLTNYYNNMKRFNKYDNMSSVDVGSGLANGTIPNDYLTYIKNIDPQRYAEIQEARKNAENQIKNESYLQEAAEQAGLGADWLEWSKYNGLFLDKNNDLVDDRLYVEPTAEEKQLVEEISGLDAEQLKLKNSLRDLQSDLTKQYPDADLSTIMILTSDRGKKIQDWMDTNNVTLTKLQGTVNYLQSERKTKMDAGKQSIDLLAKDYGMYYQYSPEGMSELAQAQYAANNITLDQANNGTETQKQMALQSVLDDYYDKYGSIIQRSEAQVINDVIAYAKKNGVSLSQALEENFLKPLREKPQFATLSSGSSTPKVTFEKVGDTGYVLTVNPDGTYSLDTVGGASRYNNGVYQFSDEEIRTGDTIGNDINSIGHILDSDDGLRIGTYTNPKTGYTYNVYANREDGIQAAENLLKRAYYGMTLEDAAQKWIGQGKDISEAKKVIKSKGLGLNDTLSDANVRKFIEAIGQWEGTLKGKSLDDWASQGRNLSKANDLGYDPLLVDFFQINPAKLMDVQWKKIKNMGYDERSYLAMRDAYLKNLSTSPDAATVDILDKLGYLMVNYPGREALIGSIGTQYLPGDYGAKMGTYRRYLDFITQNLTMDNLLKLKQNGATFGSLTEGERPRIQDSATALAPQMEEEKYLEELLNIYNTYAVKAGMGELTLDDISNMYGGSSSKVKINTPTYLQNSTAQTTTTDTNNDVDWDKIWAEM